MATAVYALYLRKQQLGGGKLGGPDDGKPDWTLGLLVALIVVIIVVGILSLVGGN